MAMNYTALIAGKTTDGSIAKWVNRSDLDIATIVSNAETWVVEEGGLRAREMLTNAAFTFNSGVNTENLPANFLDPVRLMPHGWGSALPFVLPSQLPDLRDDDGDLYTGTVPTCWTIIGTTAYIDIQLTASFSGRLTYYAKPDALSASNATNFITSRYPTMFRHVLVGMAYDFMKDSERMQTELSIASTLLETAKARNDLGMRGVGMVDSGP